MTPKHLLLIAVFFLKIISIDGQPELDSVLEKIDPNKWTASIEKKLNSFENKIIAKSLKILHHLEREEERIYKKLLATKDSGAASENLTEIQLKYQLLEDKLKKPGLAFDNSARLWIGHLDTLRTAFKFFDQNCTSAKAKEALSKLGSIEKHIQHSEEIKKFILERREELKRQLEQLGFFTELKRFNKEAYYYSEQLKECKRTLSDPGKIEKKVIDLLSKTRFCEDFMKKNSMLASLFLKPGDLNDPAYLASLAGLQTRAQVSNLIQQQINNGGSNAQSQFRNNVQQAQSQLQQLKNKLNKYGSVNSDDIMPEGFKPNPQKTKSFLKRLEYEANMQTQRSTNFFPVTSDVALSLGYKLNDRSLVGIGASYKIGWGQNFRNIHLSSQGVGVRSFIDWKMKSSFWITGGYEVNYKTAFNNLYQLQNLNAWQQMGLLGLSKVVSVKTKFFKKTKLQLLWDFLSYWQKPQTQPILFRVGYNF